MPATFFYSGMNMRHTVMNKTIQYYLAALLAMASFSVAGANADSVQNEIETFFSSGLGIIVFVLLLLLALLWLLLPLAVFGLKSKLKYLIEENTKTNRILTELRNDFAALTVEEINTAEPAEAKISSDEGTTSELIQKNAGLTREIEETNKLLAEIRDILAVLSVEETSDADISQAERTAEANITAELYDEVKFDP
jgi:hypothetical protein